MCHINFALAKAYEDLGDVGLAYKHTSGNALRKELQYEPATELFFDCLKNTFRDLQKSGYVFHKKILVQSQSLFLVCLDREHL